VASDVEVLYEPLAQATGVRECGARQGLVALGGKVDGARFERMKDSPHFDGKRFVNPVETSLAAPSLGLAWT
jgi:hypothetical protein